jgi:hypothetical protein
VGAVSGEEVEEVLDELSWLVLVKQVTGVNRDESGICELLDLCRYRDYAEEFAGPV